MKKDIMQVNEAVIKRQDEAAKDPDHPINTGLKKYFEETKRNLAEIKKSETK